MLNKIAIFGIPISVLDCLNRDLHQSDGVTRCAGQFAGAELQ